MLFKLLLLANLAFTHRPHGHRRGGGKPNFVPRFFPRSFSTPTFSSVSSNTRSFSGSSSKSSPLGLSWADGWKLLGLVPSKLSQVPPAELVTTWSQFGLTIRPNSKVDTKFMVNRPNLNWPTEPGALYTVIIADHGIERLQGKQYIHWLVENVPGNMVSSGDEVMEYIPPFYFHLENGQLVDDGQAGNPILTLVYKQPSRISMTKRQSGCNPGFVGDRIGDKEELAQEYGLEEPVAGNFLYTVYSKATDEYLCLGTRCTGEPFPAPLPGVNDGPKCST